MCSLPFCQKVASCIAMSSADTIRYQLAQFVDPSMVWDSMTVLVYGKILGETYTESGPHLASPAPYNFFLKSVSEDILVVSHYLLWQEPLVHQLQKVQKSLFLKSTRNISSCGLKIKDFEK